MGAPKSWDDVNETAHLAGADRYAARIAELTARAERAEALLADAREALESIGGVGFDAPMTWAGDDLAWANRRAAIMQQTARATLARITGDAK